MTKNEFHTTREITFILPLSDKNVNEKQDKISNVEGNYFSVDNPLLDILVILKNVV